ncbi:hypothetical protein SAMN05660649_03028 [Desulfotomaculum arcticum]|uniref:Uncharacterized protein n=1 Tax=Desulfotruncus arcticus DSM 17038 TaxID=1121424 RepID=A0A1I2VKB8_9FIRM|nr:hypothetical protein [Desulfotruncus arcticus]SFG88859.1 hypothetical protein SAMN05660649_03028 [Desulfotomaculum arcticum] [Desulfotruncus arcticus DSM 17038]
MKDHLTRGVDETRSEQISRGELAQRGGTVERGAKIHFARPSLTRGYSDDSFNGKKEAGHMEKYPFINILILAGKRVGSPVVVFPDTIAGGSFIPGTIIRFIGDAIVQISVGTVVIQDGAWKPIEPFVAGDQVFVPINAIDTFV